jgi:hypothetical protein
MKFVPHVMPFKRLIQDLGFDPIAIPDTISLKRDQFEKLIKILLRAIDIDEKWYRATYPDVDAAINKGTYKSAKHHFIADGYFEGRRPGKVFVDEDWYKQAYPDISEAVEFGEFASCQEHFDQFGEAEGRFPREY